MIPYPRESLTFFLFLLFEQRRSMAVDDPVQLQAVLGVVADLSWGVGVSDIVHGGQWLEEESKRRLLYGCSDWA
jgi:hypothetical protein